MTNTKEELAIEQTYTYFYRREMIKMKYWHSLRRIIKTSNLAKVLFSDFTRKQTNTQTKNPR